MLENESYHRRSALTRRDFIRRSAAVAAGLSWAGLPGGSIGATADIAGVSRPGMRPVAPDHRPISVYSWYSAEGLPGITPMTWQPANATGPALFLPQAIPDAFRGELIDLLVNGPNIDHWADRMRSYFRRFHPGPKRIVLDEESEGMGYGRFCDKLPLGPERVAIFRRVWNTPAAYAKLPDTVKAFHPEDFANGDGRGYRAITAWNQFADKVRNKALRTVVYEPAVEVFGDSIEVSNYGDVYYDFPIFNWINFQSTNDLFGNWSSPVCYFANDVGQRYAHRNKPIVWNNLIDALNFVRSCLNRSWRVSPWVSYPSWHDGPDDLDRTWLHGLWGEMIDHLKASGVTDFLYWNPRESIVPGDNKIASDAFAGHVPSVEPTMFHPIPLDADEIVTGQKRTRYRDWAKIKK